MKKNPAKPRTVQSVDRAVRILEELSVTPGGLGLSALARRVSLPPQTLQSLVRTLQAHRLVEQPHRGQPYTLGSRLHELHRAWADGRDLPSLAQPIVAALAEETGESVLLAEFRRRSLVPLAEKSPRRALMVRPEFEYADRVHTMATAKVLLAYFDAARREEAIAAMPFERLGPRTVATADELRRQLETVRRTGHCVCIEEAAEGVAALAVPVRDAAGAVVAALGLSLPLARMKRIRKADLLARLSRAAAEIESVWGGRGKV